MLFHVVTSGYVLVKILWKNSHFIKLAIFKNFIKNINMQHSRNSRNRINVGWINSDMRKIWMRERKVFLNLFRLFCYYWLADIVISVEFLPQVMCTTIKSLDDAWMILSEVQIHPKIMVQYVFLKYIEHCFNHVETHMCRDSWNMVQIGISLGGYNDLHVFQGGTQSVCPSICQCYW